MVISLTTASGTLGFLDCKFRTAFSTCFLLKKSLVSLLKIRVNVLFHVALFPELLYLWQNLSVQRMVVRFILIHGVVMLADDFCGVPSGRRFHRRPNIHHELAPRTN